MAASLLERWAKTLRFKELVIHDGFEIVVEFDTSAPSTFFSKIQAIGFRGVTFTVKHEEEVRTGTRFTVTFLGEPDRWPAENFSRHEGLTADSVFLTFLWGGQTLVFEVKKFGK